MDFVGKDGETEPLFETEWHECDGHLRNLPLHNICYKCGYVILVGFLVLILISASTDSIHIAQ